MTTFLPLLLFLACSDPHPKQAPTEAAKQAARAAPHGPPYQGPWTALLVGDAPKMAKMLNLSPQPKMSPLPPGTVGLLMIPAGSDVDHLKAQGEWVAVLGAGSKEWRDTAAEALPWAGFAVVDPTAELSAWANPEGPAAPFAEELAAQVILQQYHLKPAVRLPGEYPPGLAQWLWGASPADFQSADPRVRSEAVRAGPVIPSELARLSTDPESVVRLAVALRTNDTAILARLAEDPEPWVRARVADRSSDLEILRRLCEDASSLVRVVAVHRVAHLSGTTAQAGIDEILEKAAQSPDAYLRWKAASGLRNQTMLAKLLSADPDIDVRRAAARSLGQAAGRGALEEVARKALIAGSQQSNSFVRRWSVEALGSVRTPETEAAVKAAASDPTSLVAQAAGRVLQRWGIPMNIPPFLPGTPPKDDTEIAQRAASADATVRKDLCKFLADGKHLAQLKILATDADSEVRKSAVEAMGWGPDATAELETALSDSDLDVVVTALDGLRRSGRGDPDKILPLFSHTDHEIRLRATEALASLSPPPETLRTAATDPDERIRAAVVRAFPQELSPQEPSALVRRSAGHPTDALSGLSLDADMPFWLNGLYAREDDFLHERFSWNDEADRPSAYDSLRPPVLREYGHPDRG